ncbi:class I SAM-dependent methyltransferase, partial [Streptococcus pyogenes]
GDIFDIMLDANMQYLCGCRSESSSLDEAQAEKLQRICEKLQLAPGMRILDIGCGWGGTAEYMARHYDVYVEGITDSTQQQKIA